MENLRKCELCGRELEDTSKTICSNCQKDIDAKLISKPEVEATPNKSDNYSEEYINGFATFIKIVGTLGLIGSIIVFAIMAVDGMVTQGAIVFGAGIVGGVGCFIWGATLKTFANISLTLKEINSKLEKQ